MTTRLKLAFSCHLLFALLLTAFALTYLFRAEFMPYHGDAVGLKWVDVEPPFQVLVLALMRVVGGAWLATVAAIVILLLLPFRRGEVWARWAIPAVGMCAAVPGLYATIYVTQNTLATAPWAATAAGIFLMLIGLGLSLAADPMTGAGKNRDLAEDE